MSPERREAKRSAIVAAARRCFSRNGFHRTSMPDIATEAGVSTGAPYRYFASKDELILEVAGDAFRLLFEPVLRRAAQDEATTVGDLAEAAMLSSAVDAPRREAQDMLRCAVQAWAELLRNEHLAAQARNGFEDVRGRIADALRRGQETHSAPAALDADLAARAVMALLHGFVLQRVAFGLDDIDGLAGDVGAALGAVGLLKPGSTS